MNETAALAIRDDQLNWSERQLAVLHQTGISDAVSPQEFAGFLHVCQRTRLDPFAKQIYLVPRWNSDLGREVFTPQVGIDGFRVVARRAADAAGEKISYEGPYWCGTDGQWRGVWLDEGPPAAARWVIFRDGQPHPGVALYREFAARKRDGTPTPMWARMPANQLAKCAEAQALRKAFPNDLSGLVTAEEAERQEVWDREHQPAPPKMTRHVREPDAVSREWEPGTLEHDRATNHDALCRAQADVQAELNRLEIWNRADRLHETAYVLGRLDDPPGSFADLSLDEAMRATAALRERPAPGNADPAEAGA